MAMVEGLDRILREHPFFHGLPDPLYGLISGCARNALFAPGEHIFREGGEAGHFYLLREGQVALQLASGEGAVITFQTIGAGEILGASWLVPPFRWTFDARALERTRTIALDAVCVRTKCEQNPELGWDLMKRLAPVLVERMQAARLQMLDVYACKS
jgi:CRP-like cAMP-binding protein